MRKKNVAYYTMTKALDLRLQTLMTEDRFSLHRSQSEYGIMNIYKDLVGDLDMILIDVDELRDKGIDLLKRLRSMDRNLPIFILTSNSKKSFFIEAMLSGATEYILKPFKDELIINKLNSYLMISDEVSSVEIISFDISNYLKGEIRKAEKGNFSLSLMFATFHRTDEDILAEKNNQKVYNTVHNGLKTLFWDTDIFIRFGLNYYVGVFPFCTVENTEIIKLKVEDKFEELKRSIPQLIDYSFTTAFITFPDEIKESECLLDELINKVKSSIGYIEEA
jgi:response regulator of citrate/malate metabolism